MVQPDMIVQTPLPDGMDKENVGPSGRQLRSQHINGLGSIGRKVLGRRDNTLPQECLSTQKLAILKPRSVGTPSCGAKMAATPTGGQVSCTLLL